MSSLAGNKEDRFSRDVTYVSLYYNEFHVMNSYIKCVHKCHDSKHT